MGIRRNQEGHTGGEWLRRRELCMYSEFGVAGNAKDRSPMTREGHFFVSGRDVGLCLEEVNALIVADGMGELPASKDVASIAVGSVADFLMSCNMDGYAPYAATDRLSSMVVAVDEQVKRAKATGNIESHGGATLAFTQLFNDAHGVPCLAWASVGDSIIALRREDTVWDVNLEETMAATIGRDDGNYDASLSHALTNSIEGNSKLTLVRDNTGVISLQPNVLYRLVVATDGIEQLFMNRKKYRSRTPESPGNIQKDFIKTMNDFRLDPGQVARRLQQQVHAIKHAKTDDMLIFCQDFMAE